MIKTYIEMNGFELEEFVAKYGLDDNMFFALYWQAKKKIEEQQLQIHQLEKEVSNYRWEASARHAQNTGGTM